MDSARTLTIEKFKGVLLFICAPCNWKYTFEIQSRALVISSFQILVWILIKVLCAYLTRFLNSSDVGVAGVIYCALFKERSSSGTPGITLFSWGSVQTETQDKGSYHHPLLHWYQPQTPNCLSLQRAWPLIAKALISHPSVITNPMMSPVEVPPHPTLLSLYLNPVLWWQASSIYSTMADPTQIFTSITWANCWFTLLHITASQ